MYVKKSLIFLKKKKKIYLYGYKKKIKLNNFLIKLVSDMFFFS